MAAKAHIVIFVEGDTDKLLFDALVTHNPNVVVSSDTENVIVANQQGNDSMNDNGCRFQYISGALENTTPKDADCEYILKSQGMREHVCEILEGGEVSFIKREQKYGFKH